jgi:RiboL-PSP-HEPN
MGITIDDFRADVRTLLLGIDALDKMDRFASQVHDGAHVGNDYLNSANDLHVFVRTNISSLLMWPPSIILYICGRFEYYVRSAVESTADEMMTIATNYSDLPLEMRNTYFKMAMDVISNPKKFGKPASTVISLLKSVSDNLNLDTPSIESFCLSTTVTNMRPDVINELFKRLGYQEFWTTVGASTHGNERYMTIDSKIVIEEAKAELNSIMEIRNTIAHPASSTSYPDVTAAKKAIEYFLMLSTITEDVCRKVIIKHRSSLTAPSSASIV